MTWNNIKRKKLQVNKRQASTYLETTIKMTADTDSTQTGLKSEHPKEQEASTYQQGLKKQVSFVNQWPN